MTVDTNTSLCLHMEMQITDRVCRVAGNLHVAVGGSSWLETPSPIVSGLGDLGLKSALATPSKTSPAARVRNSCGVRKSGRAPHLARVSQMATSAGRSYLNGGAGRRKSEDASRKIALPLPPLAVAGVR